MKPFPLTELFSFDIEPFCSIVKFESGESILEEGTDASPLYYLMEGRAKLFLTHENGRTSLVSFLDAPCFIGEMEFLGAQQCANGVYREKHTETAEFLGVSYRHLLYVIAAFVKKGILTKNSSGYLITDSQALHDLADSVSIYESSGL